MTETTADRDLEAVARRAEEVYARRVAETVRPEQAHQFVVIDLDSEDFEIDADDFAAINRLELRRPNAVLYLCRVGLEAAYETEGRDADRERHR